MRHLNSEHSPKKNIWYIQYSFLLCLPTYALTVYFQIYTLYCCIPLLTFEYWDNYAAVHIWVMNSRGIGPFARPYQFPYVHHYSLTCIHKSSFISLHCLSLDRTKQKIPTSSQDLFNILRIGKVFEHTSTKPYGEFVPDPLIYI